MQTSEQPLPLAPPTEMAVAPAPTHGDALVLMFERLATDPRVDVDKLERLIEMQRGIVKANAAAAFNAAYTQMQREMPAIEERGQIAVKGTVRSTYAKLEDIAEVLRPVLHKHGFAIRHRTEWPEAGGIIRIVGILSHEQGHSEESVFQAPADRSDFRTDIQSMGSTVSYGRRYTTLDLLNIVTKQADDDGADNSEGARKYANWLLDLEAVARSDGYDGLVAAIKKGGDAYRKALASSADWPRLKAIAAKSGAMPVTSGTATSAMPSGTTLS